VEFRIVGYKTEGYDLMLALRTKVLREPLGLSFSEEDLQKEAPDTFCVCSQDDNIIACCVLTRQSDTLVKLRQMAVDWAFRGKGIGELMLNFAEVTAKDSGYSEIVLHARKEAVGFYSQYGYEVSGDYFTEVGIPHLKMKKHLIY